MKEARFRWGSRKAHYFLIKQPISHNSEVAISQTSFIGNRTENTNAREM